MLDAAWEAFHNLLLSNDSSALGGVGTARALDIERGCKVNPGTSKRIKA